MRKSFMLFLSIGFYEPVDACRCLLGGDLVAVLQRAVVPLGPRTAMIEAVEGCAILEPEPIRALVQIGGLGQICRPPQDSPRRPALMYRNGSSVLVVQLRLLQDGRTDHPQALDRKRAQIAFNGLLS